MPTSPAGSRRGLSFLAGALLCVVACRLEAQDAVPARNSLLTGIPLPADAQRLVKKEIQAEAVQALEAMAKQLGRECAAPEVLVWTGSGLPATEEAIQAVARQLQKSGYSYMEQVPPREMPAVMKRILAARNTKQSVLGFWAAGEGLLTLAWCRVGPGDGAPAGSKEQAASDRMPPFPKRQPRPDCVLGTALGLNGKPLAGAEIVIHGTTLAGRNTSFTVKTDSKGYYELPLPPGVYKLSMGTYRVRYGGLDYRLPLRTESGEADTIVSKKGGVGNWVLVMRGRVPGSDLLYGGSASVEIANNRSPKEAGWPEGAMVDVTLTPQGPLADGSAGQPVTGRYQVPAPSLFSTSILFSIPGVPVGRYMVTVRLIEPGKAPRPLGATIEVLHPNLPVETFPAAEKPLYFYPAEAGMQGVERSRILLQP